VIVADASVVVAALLRRGMSASWAESVMVDEVLVAPHLMPGEVAHVLRRTVLAGEISADFGALVHHDLVDMPILLVPYGPYFARIWELHDNVSTYDAWYIAVAETFDCPLATLDRRLARAPGPRCDFRLPD
jgi:predicted nucleic acid-binding protein